ncbi:hypothetical protein R80B4_00802 [Fibrobacteres bacterium R8-0-B4]
MSLHLNSATGRYIPLSPEEKYLRLVKIDKFIKRYAGIVPGMDYTDIVCRKDILLDIIEKVEKRRVYFHVFHGITMSEQNEVSLYCFWLLKLSPFFNKKHPNHSINTSIAFFMLYEAVRRISAHKGRPFIMGKDYAHDLIYAFQNRDISKEAVMLTIKSLLV